MQNTYRVLRVAAAVFIGFVLALTFLRMMPASAQVGKEVPYGNQVSPEITKYNRLRPSIATAGPLKDGAISELKSLGFATVLDLRCSDEGADVEKRAVDREDAVLKHLGHRTR